jgi:hypothetical protein
MRGFTIPVRREVHGIFKVFGVVDGGFGNEGGMLVPGVGGELGLLRLCAG